MLVCMARRRVEGSIETLPSGRLRVRVYAGADPVTGRQRYLREIVDTSDEAKATRARLLQQVYAKQRPRSDITVDQAITRWLEVAGHAVTTRERYEDLISLYVSPSLGGLLLTKVDAELLERFYARLVRCRHLCSGAGRRGHVCEPLAATTVRKIHFILRGTFERAVRWRYLNINEAAMAAPPVLTSHEPDPPTPEEAARLINEAWSIDPAWGLLLWLTMLTGSRRGEISALRWRHVDLERGTLTVERSNAHTRTGLQEKTTKSTRRRRVALDEGTVALLKEHRDHVEHQCEQIGVRRVADAFLFSLSPDGSTPLRPHGLSQRYHRLAVRMGLRSTRLHSLRHYAATQLVAAGVDIRTVAGRLGHGSGGATTLKVYAAWSDAADRRAAGTMANLMPVREPVRRTRAAPYKRIAVELAEAIGSGNLKPGDQLPTVLDLAASYKVSPNTIIRAVAVLKGQGLIDVARGRRAIVLAKW
jgi:integrase